MHMEGNAAPDPRGVEVCVNMLLVLVETSAILLSSRLLIIFLFVNFFLAVNLTERVFYVAN